MTFEDYVRESLQRIENEQKEIRAAVERRGDKLEETFRLEIGELDVRVSRNSAEISKLDKAIVTMRTKFLLAASGVGAIVGAAVAFAIRLLEHQVIG